MEDLAEQRMSHGEGESEPSVRLIDMLDVRHSRREPGEKRNLEVRSGSRDFDVEVVAAADEVKSARG